MSDYRVQFQDSSGWRNCITMSAQSTPHRILIEMKNAQSMYPRSRIRVVDENDRIIDILN